MKHWPTLAALALLAACNGAGPQQEATPAKDAGDVSPTTGPTVALATRDDVAEAIRCHLELSGMMAAQIASSAPPRRFGPAVRYWHGLIDERARAAGIDETELKSLRAEVIDARGQTGETAQSKAFGEDCYASAPSA